MDNTFIRCFDTQQDQDNFILLHFDIKDIYSTDFDILLLVRLLVFNLFCCKFNNVI